MQSALLSNGDVMYYGVTKMGIPSTSSARQCAFWLTETLANPVCQITIRNTTHVVGAGTAMVVYAIDLFPPSNPTEVAVSAQTITGNEVTGDYYCHWQIIGTPIK